MMYIKPLQSFRKVIYLELVFIIIATVFILGYLWISGEYNTFNQDSEKRKQEFISNQQILLKNEVNSQIDYIQYMRVQTEERLKENIKNRTYEAYDIAMNIYNQNKDKKSKQEVQKLIKDTLRDIRFNNGRGYYFIDTLDGNVILYPTMPETEGTNILEIKDQQGNYALKDEINLVKSQNEGIITGYWTNPNYKDNEGHKKITFVKKFEPYNWYMGTGEYVDDVENDIKKEIIHRIGAVRFGEKNDNYIFIDNFDGVEICNSVYPGYVGKNIWDMEDLYGTKIIQQQTSIAKNNEEGGFLTHYWKTPDLNNVFQKMTFVRAVPEWNWVIGSGVQFDELQNTVNDNEAKIKEKVIQKIKNIIILLIAVLIVAFILTRYLMKKTQKSFDIFFDFLNNASRKHVKIDVEKMEYNEFKELAIAANTMVDERNRIEQAIRIMNDELKERVQQRTKEIEELNANLDKKVDERTLELSNLLNIDGLTQIYNHKYMIEKLKIEIKKAKESDEKLCVIMFDIDHFKSTNDNYGHQCGDDVLVAVAGTINEHMRENDAVGRYGGEEFIAILSKTNIEIGYKIVEKIRQRIMSLQFKQKGLSITISGGIIEHSYEDAIEIIRKADEKLYQAKKKGRNRIER
ncbi:sensor domain-containing diguanylate cyclase [Clostridium saccharobutylicum]|uniref:Sensory box histidine kinase/response regulator protein n=2 Tax=Clostridium saccharobutylicum TaxID=169679 RepID=U5MQN7_CLOSA|nr:cache domain-containing protein [Clostridium saccharobutylicum]AGX41752.1 sensory box histidine kinase/response regulator protein [Clostridium saccharobutylicum DSM 13864]AQR89031.1 response regulator PleD [Clostridium saccharobutylicum]AQR98932.1 response regulator PleD [Clostridium saccharobutylicum]AQS08651.1 response regulator PleD [Clostridium saccharobutylicum]AQS12920.1 response regulator PleD [Clostridium saccharobutylicum]